MFARTYGDGIRLGFGLFQFGDVPVNFLDDFFGGNFIAILVEKVFPILLFQTLVLFLQIAHIIGYALRIGTSEFCAVMVMYIRLFIL